ncbi:heme ABC transporter ATP-binding protein [Pseudomaricurvus alkylphenolicus]|uniref:heme ABC transporter ATP-binding protein n=1 Tax=Pseudomaricurvus alkylphenolicus TaxID=1306991 RepID=UPI0014232AB0|nr:heme ABC transporter ATP-binding protein [Pseudomaricurvus alkylphenolicus]NIB39981.1 heme ABC transporter ATP-binding protein [Pseudomaricurvus alkylphenolicus]
MLRLNNIQLRFGSVPILQDIDLHLQAGEVVAVLGPNGAGKSSLLKVASGELLPVDGDAQFNGDPLRSLPVQLKARHMAVLPQLSLLNFPFQVDEVVLLGRTPHDTGIEADRRIVDEALRAVDAHYLRRQLYTQLSGGEKQRVQMARVLTQIWEAGGEGDRLLILDEPTSALDYAHQRMVGDIMRRLADNGVAVLTALHDLNLAAGCADRIVLMRCGRIFAEGTPEEVMQEDLLREVFEVDFHRVTHPQTGKPWLLS